MGHEAEETTKPEESTNGIAVRALYIGGLMLVMASLSVLLWAGYQRLSGPMTVAEKTAGVSAPAVLGAVPDFLESAPKRAREAYAIAGENKELLTQVFCSCGCTHEGVYGCFYEIVEGKTVYNEHGAMCRECIDAALVASEWYEQGKTIERIRDMLARR